MVSNWSGFLPQSAIVMARKGARPNALQEGVQTESLSTDTAEAEVVISESPIPFYGRGNPEAELMFVGEMLSESEIQLLSKMIEAMGLTFDQVYLAQLFKDGSTGEEGVGTRLPSLKIQIAMSQPHVIVALGLSAVKALLSTDLVSSDDLLKIRGRYQQLNGIDLMPTFHPSHLLSVPSAKRDAWEDLKQVAQTLGLSIPTKSGR